MPFNGVAQKSTTVSVGTTSTTIVGSNLGRRELLITNDGSNIVYLALNTTDGAAQPAAAPARAPTGRATTFSCRPRPV